MHEYCQHTLIKGRQKHSKLSSKEHTKQKKSIEKTLKYQNSLAVHRTLPTKIRPHLPTVVGDRAINDQLIGLYKKMFFYPLDRVITSNTTDLELVKNKLSSIIPEVESFLKSPKRIDNQTSPAISQPV